MPVDLHRHHSRCFRQGLVNEREKYVDHCSDADDVLFIFRVSFPISTVAFTYVLNVDVQRLCR